jgi:hypothetical protein
VLQIALWSVAAGALLDAVFASGRTKKLAVVVLAFEPVGMYYRVSLLSEGLFEAALMAQTALLLRRRHLEAGLAAAVAISTRYAAVFCAPLWLGSLFSSSPAASKHEKTVYPFFRCKWRLCPHSKHFVVFFPCLALLAVALGHRRFSAGSTGPGAFLAFHVRPHIPECLVPDSLPRQEIVRRQAVCLARVYFAGHSPAVAKVKADSVLWRRSLTPAPAEWIDIYFRHLGDNLYAVFTRNRLDYRRDETVFHAHEYRELDELARRLYGLRRRTPECWIRHDVWNAYMTVFWTAGTATIAFAFLRRKNVSLLLTLSVLPVLLAVLGPVPYKTRFVAPWMGLALAWMISVTWTIAVGQRSGRFTRG